MLRIGRASKLVLVIAVGAIGLAACGGGSSGSSSDTTTTTKAAPAGALDPSAKQAAAEIAATQEVLGAEWSQYRKAGGFQKMGKSSCAVKSGSGVTATDEPYNGPMFRDVSETAYIYTAASVFRTEADAQAFTAMINTSEFQKCKEAADDAAQKKRDPKTFVRMTTTTDPAVGTGGLDAYLVETPGGLNEDGTEYTSGSYNRYYYRSGRVVYAIQVDVGLPKDAASVEPLGARVNQAIEDLQASLESKVQALEL